VEEGATCLCRRVARRGVCEVRRVHSEGHRCSARAVAAGRMGGSDGGLVRSAVILVMPVVLGMLAAPAVGSACTLVVWMGGLRDSRRTPPGGGAASAFSLRSSPWWW
jgi:hypothetical protein